MKKRLLFLLSTYLLTVFAFIVDKLAFMLFNGRGESLSVLDVVKVVMHGLTLDLSTALYLLAIP